LSREPPAVVEKNPNDDPFDEPEHGSEQEIDPRTQDGNPKEVKQIFQAVHVF
jgi:hypothetical protein